MTRYRYARCGRVQTSTTQNPPQNSLFKIDFSFTFTYPPMYECRFHILIPSDLYSKINHLFFGEYFPIQLNIPYKMIKSLIQEYQS